MATEVCSAILTCLFPACASARWASWSWPRRPLISSSSCSMCCFCLALSMAAGCPWQARDAFPRFTLAHHLLQKTQRPVAEASNMRIADATCGSSDGAAAVRPPRTRSRAPTCTAQRFNSLVHRSSVPRTAPDRWLLAAADCSWLLHVAVCCWLMNFADCWLRLAAATSFLCLPQFGNDLLLYKVDKAWVDPFGACTLGVHAFLIARHAMLQRALASAADEQQLAWEPPHIHIFATAFC